MAIEISLKKGTANPTSGLTLAEPLFNSTNNTLWMGKGSGNTPVWLGAGICGASGGIAAGLTYQIPTLGAVKDYVAAVGGGGGTGAVSSVSGSGNGISVSPTTGAVVVSNTGVHSFNGLTGVVQGVSSAVAGTGISVSAATGSVTITNTGVHSFNGLTGAVGGVCAAQANTFTALQTFTTGIIAAGGITFNGPVTGATATFTRLLTASGGISASGGMTLDGGKVWTSANDGPTSGLDAGQLYGVTASLYASSLSTGLLYGGLVTINAGNSAAFDITAGAGYIVTTGATYTADPTPVITRVGWTAKTGVTLSGLTAQDTTWIYFDSTGALKQQATFFTDTQIQSTLAIGALVHPSRSYISLAKSIPNVSYATDKQYEQFIRAFGPLKVSGHTIQPNGANLKLDRSSGTAFILGRNYPNDPDNPSVVSDNAQTDCTFWRYYRGVTADSFVTVLNQTAIDPDRYDDGSGTLKNVPNNKFSIQRLFFFPGTPTVLGVYYGHDVYASMADAANNIHFEDFTEIQNTTTNAIFAGYLLVKKGTTNLTTAIAADTARIIQSGQFRSTTSGGGSVATNLDNLSDVIVTSVQDDDLLIYDTATSQWLNTPLQHIGVTRVNGATGSVQVVSSFNGRTGAVTGASLGANTFTALNSFNAGISSAGGTFSSLARFTAGLTASSVYGGTVYTNNIVAQDGISPVYINDSGSEKITYIGDYSGAGNSTLLTVDDSINTITLGGQVTATSSLAAARISSAATIYFGTGLAHNDSVSTPLTTTASNQIIWDLPLGDTTVIPFSAVFRSAEFMIQATKGTTFEAMKMLVINDDTNTWNTQYGVIRNGATMGSYNTTIVTVGTDKYLRLRVTPTYTSTTFKVAGTFLPS